MSTSEGKPTLIIGEYPFDFEIERQLRGTLHFYLIEDPDMNAVMYGNDIYAAGKSLYSSPNKMTELVYALTTNSNINAIVTESRALAELIVQKVQLVASQAGIAVKSHL
ncbi:hypothetical protein M405DRAFT_897664 [Rhizopogon salebrosus TDB-379]|nr:hypothetical protein M405DRAFT_897664 [Rhizopogon salebrosus TDB-379]